MENLDHLRYPNGRLELPSGFNFIEVKSRISEIRAFPSQLSSIVISLTQNDLQQTYRPDSWTIRQIVHHLADSHINAYIRFKWTLTEENPIIKPYLEKSWAELWDTQHTDVMDSVTLLSLLHKRWCILMDHMEESHWNKQLIHPDREKPIFLYQLAHMYAWHGKHHIAHINLALAK